jgi:hypothetical protein
MFRKAVPAALAALVVTAAPAAAATQTQTVSGLVGTELSLAVTTPPTPMTFSNSSDGTSSAVLAITSTSSWTLSIKDAASTTPGQMDKVDCVTRAAGTGSLSDPLQWAVPAGNSGTLTGSDQTVATGFGIAVKTVNFTQTVPATEGLSAGDCYQLTSTFTLA